MPGGSIYVWPTLTKGAQEQAMSEDPVNVQACEPKPVAILKGHSGYPRCVKFSPTRSLIASAAAAVALWIPKQFTAPIGTQTDPVAIAKQQVSGEMRLPGIEPGTSGYSWLLSAIVDGVRCSSLLLPFLLLRISRRETKLLSYSLRVYWHQGVLEVVLVAARMHKVISFQCSLLISRSYVVLCSGSRYARCWEINVF